MSFISRLCVVALAVLSSGVSAGSAAPPSFTDKQIQLIRANAIAGSKKSWELGTLTEALTELDAYELSAFGADALPVNASRGSLPPAVLKILDDVIAHRSDDTKAFVKDGSAGDPTSLGAAAIVAGITTGDQKYVGVSGSQLRYFLHQVPRGPDNLTVSHRTEQFQAWSDFLSMAPPFLAMYASTEGNDGSGLMYFAYQQVQGYRNLLRDPQTGLWRHVVAGNWDDKGFWATGNGWAAHGALRVEATISKSQFAKGMQAQIKDIQNWVDEILTACWKEQDDKGLLHNYMQQDSFPDAAGTALLAAATYRHALVTGNTAHIGKAEKAFRAVLDLVGDDGWVNSVVDPYHFSQSADRSPEAQSFLLLLHVASQKFYQPQLSPARLLASALLEGINAGASA